MGLARAACHSSAAGAEQQRRGRRTTPRLATSDRFPSGAVLKATVCALRRQVAGHRALEPHPNLALCASASLDASWRVAGAGQRPERGQSQPLASCGAKGDCPPPSWRGEGGEVRGRRAHNGALFGLARRARAVTPRPAPRGCCCLPAAAAAAAWAAAFPPPSRPRPRPRRCAIDRPPQPPRHGLAARTWVPLCDLARARPPPQKTTGAQSRVSRRTKRARLHTCRQALYLATSRARGALLGARGGSHARGECPPGR